MAKNIETPETENVETVYEHETEAPKRSFLKSKQAKVAGAIAGGLIILGGTFAAGVQVGEHQGPDLRGQFGQQGFGDGDHDRGGFTPNGQHPLNGQPGPNRQDDDNRPFNPNPQGTATPGTDSQNG